MNYIIESRRINEEGLVIREDCPLGFRRHGGCCSSSQKNRTAGRLLISMENQCCGEDRHQVSVPASDRDLFPPQLCLGKQRCNISTTPGKDPGHPAIVPKVKRTREI
jgi:hypothetical protein